MLAICKVSRLKLASVAESYLVANHEDRFSRDVTHIIFLNPVFLFTLGKKKI